VLQEFQVCLLWTLYLATNNNNKSTQLSSTPSPRLPVALQNTHTYKFTIFSNCLKLFMHMGLPATPPCLGSPHAVEDKTKVQKGKSNKRRCQSYSYVWEISNKKTNKLQEEHRVCVGANVKWKEKRKNIHTRSVRTTYSYIHTYVCMWLCMGRQTYICCCYFLKAIERILLLGVLL